MDVDVQVEKTGAYLAKLSVTVAQRDVDKTFAKMMRRKQKEAVLKGFRPGKIPPALLELHFGAEVHSEVQKKLVEASLFTALGREDVAAVGMPKVTLGPLKRGSAFHYTAEVEIRPEITFVQYKGLAAPKIVVEVNEADVSAYLETMRKEAAQTVPATDRTTAAPGDFVLLDYVGYIDGVPFEGGKADNALVELGAGDYITGFAEGIEGAQVPGKREVELSFPADYGVAHLAGKLATFSMDLKELKVRELPKLDDAFAQDMGADSLEALRDKVRTHLTDQQKQSAESQQRLHILKALVAANPLEVPPSLVDSQVEQLVRVAHARMERMAGQKIDLGSQDIAEIRGSSREHAEFMVRSGLFVMQLSEIENLGVEDADVDEEIEKLVSQAGEQGQAARRAYQQEARRDDLRFRLMEDRVVAFLLREAVLEEPVTT